MAKRKVLVTGGAGFIGSHLVDQLLKKNYEVVVMDNLSTGYAGYLPPKVTLVNADVRQKAKVAALFKKYHFDIVCHIAGLASNINSFTDPYRDMEVNFFGTMNVVLSCLAFRVPRLLYASSMTVYGHPDKLPVAESQICRPFSYYGISKYAAERFAHATAERPDLKFPLRVTSFRMFNVYGPRQSLTNPYQGALAIFIGNLLRREPVKIFGDGKQSRDFIYIEDIVKAWTEAIDNPKSYGQVYNLGFGKQISIKELVTTIIRAFRLNPAKYPIRYLPGRPGEQRFMQADISLARRELNFRPQDNLASGLAKTIRWSKTEKTR